MANRDYWIGVIARDAVQVAMKAGFAQLSHGKKEPLTGMQAGDGFIFYSPRDHFPGGKPYQKFTGVGRVSTGIVYESGGGTEPKPFRIDIQFYPSHEADVRPLIDQLSFIEDKTHWGYPFRFGYLKIPEQDFRLIAAAMGVNVEKEFGE